jgi:hypothetical protein
MAEWLDRELARELAPAAAPEALGIRLGLAPVKRRAFPGAGLAVAAAVVFILGSSYAANRTAALDLGREAGAGVVLRTADDAPMDGARVMRCDGGAGVPLRVNAEKATILLAHSGFERGTHTLAAAPEADCGQCHSL